MQVCDIEFPFEEKKNIYGYYPDTVFFAYTKYDRNNKERTTVSSVKSYVCYHNFLCDTDFPYFYEVMCCPNEPIHVLPFNYFEDAFKLFHRHKLIPKDLMVHEEQGKAYLKLEPFKSHLKSHVYVALCLYRWCDSSPKLVYEMLHIVKEYPDIDLWQVLHYVAGKYVTGTGHSFFNVHKSNFIMLSSSLMAKRFFVNILDDNFVKTTFVTSLPSSYNCCYFINNIHIPVEHRLLKINKLVEILDSKWSPYYNAIC